MNILHICSITNNKSSGISMVVPEHYLYQSQYENVTLLNCNDTVIEKLKNKDKVFYWNRDLEKNIINLDKLIGKMDIVVFHGVYITEYLRIYKFLIKKDIPYIIIPHGSLTSNAQEIKKLKKIIANCLFFKDFINNAYYIQYLSKQEEKLSIKFKHKHFIEGNGLNDSKLKKKEFSTNGLKLIYVGRYDIYHKGIDILISGCEKIKDFLIEKGIKVSLYGTGNDGKVKINEIVKKSRLKEIISVNEAIFDEEKVLKILDSDVFIQTSRLEGQPLGVIEAFMLGMPVILSSGTSFDNIERLNMGFLANTPQEVANAIIKCYNQKDKLPLMSKASIKFYKENFNWENIAQRSIEDYKKILEERTSDKK